MRAELALVILLCGVGGCLPPENLQTENPSPQLQPVIVPNDMIACLIDASGIKYVPDPPGTDYWQSPQETQEKNQGDCEDLCIYLQDRLRRKGIHVEVVFGMKTALAKNGHGWCEYEQDGELYIIEPGSGGFLKRKSLPSFLYIRAEGIDVVTKKIEDYYKRTGICVNSSYRELIESVR